MTQNLDRYDGNSLEPADSDIETLLAEAYPAAAVPKSLQKRLDRMLAEQWGTPSAACQPVKNGLSIGPERTRRGRGAGRRPGVWTAWSGAVSLAAAILLVISFWGNERAYGWGKMVDALSRQGIIQVAEGSEGTDLRWLSLSEKTLGQRSRGRTQWIDFEGGVLLQHQQTETHVRRRKLHDLSAAAQHERLVLSLLLGGPRANSAGVQLPDLKVIEESWERQGDRVQLDVLIRLAPPVLNDEISNTEISGDKISGDEIPPGEELDEAAQILSLRLWLDAESHLPLSSQITHRDGRARRLSFSYPTTTAAELATRVIPSELPIVDAGLPETVSRAVTLSRGDQDGPQDEPQDEPQNNASADGGRSQQDPRVIEESKAPPAEVLTGAASLSWAPVPALDLPPDEFVRRVDATLQRLWAKKGIEPAAPASDEELLRRVYLDLAGRTPTVHEIRSYLDDSSPARYPALVDRLLASDDHATHLATVWRNMLLPAGTDLSQFGGVETFDQWLSDQFEKNTPYDALVRQLLLAEGRLTSSGPLLFYAALKLDADQLAAKSSRVFLGMRLECAQCHDDPFEPWTQQDFWSYAAFFARISRPQAELASVSTVMRVRDVDRGEVTLPDSDQVVTPRLLDGSKANEATQSGRRHQLARWLTAPKNPYFAKATVNRVWAHLFGRGIVDPVDGFGQQHPAASPELLDLLAGQFLHQKFNLRGLFRTVALSQAYQLSSGSPTPDPRRHEWFAQQNIKMLTAEQLYDCITVATLLGASGSGEFTIARMGDAGRTEFLQQFQTLSGNRTEYQGGIPQSLTLMNGQLIGNATGLTSSGLLKSLEAPFFTDASRVEVVYLATLSRRPTPAERQIVRNYLADRQAGTSVLEPLGDVLWALLNSAEFTMNH